MNKTNVKSEIIQLHSSSPFAESLLDHKKDCEYTVLQIETITTSKYDYLVEIIKRKDYNPLDVY